MSLRVALLSSGLGRVNRGIEVWTQSLAEALQRRGMNCTAFGGGSGGARQERMWRTLPNIGMFSSVLGHHSGRLNWNYRQILQQLTFAASFLPHTNNFDIVHSADLYVSLVLERARQYGIFHGRVIYCDESCFDLAKLNAFSCVQETSEFYLKQAKQLGIDTSGWYVIPNFVDSCTFNPEGDRFPRDRLGIPEDAFVILSVGAIEKPYKRMDWLIREVSHLSSGARRRIVLLIVGSREDQTEDVVALGKRMLGENFRVVVDADRVLMPSLYRLADVFCLASTNERFGIALLEAMATCLPVLYHQFPVTKWIVGSGGVAVDMTRPGALSQALRDLLATDYRKLGEIGRRRVLSIFDTGVVVPAIQRMYEEVAQADAH